MVRRGLLVTLLVLFWLAAIPLPVRPEPGPQFRLGFELLAGLIPAIVGDPMEDEHHNPINGDALQATSGGLLVWRKADNWTAFTNGWRSWVNGPRGLEERGNDERFEWELEPVLAEGPPPLPTDSFVSPTADSAPTTYPTSTATPPSPTVQPTRAEADPTSTPVQTIPTPTSVPATVTPTATLVPSATPTTIPTRPTSTAVPSPTATSTSRPTASPTPSATARTASDAGIQSPEPAGEWVTSKAASTKYYTSRDNAYWTTWSEKNRIWFATESALLAAYPGRVRK